MSNNADIFNFKDKVALVSGSSSGIGEAVAILLTQLGARVTITGRDATNLERVVQECHKVNSPGVLSIVGDITDEAIQAKLITDTVAEFGRLDILVNNVGAIFSTVPFTETDQFMKVFDDTLAVNLRSVVRLTSLAIPHLTKTKGNIVNISSVGSTMADLNAFAYCISKAALDMFTKCSAISLASKGIRVNSINPGPIITNLVRAFTPKGVNKEDAFLEYSKRTALKRYGHPMEVAWNVAFLVSNKAEFITGAFHTIDGGYLLAASNYDFQLPTLE